MRKLVIAIATIAFFTIPEILTANTNNVSLILQEKQYKKIDVSSVPKDTLDKIKKDYGNYTIKEAYKADDGEYKLILTKDGIDLTATFTTAGDLIKILN